MGYRSEVALVVNDEDAAEIIRFTSEKWPENSFFKESVWCESHKLLGQTLFYWSYVKWYDEEEEVRAVFEYLKDKGYSYCRLGDDNDDMEYRCENKFDDMFSLGYVRKLVWEGSGE